ncbi:hypothetical protein ARMA_1251 [Ardenticatena maritima]|uniref:Alpha-galactosidase NEW3 domain-containing protein n=1 Tax=Ardenticatena maritima TaxID=872965 RepID=A0A0M9UCD9_9CHLR|nr:NEW3 domain-containing protein [Ardenticatena maritima]KPL86375.1 hypothetical protein SE16_13740 [Ardenticatena maritima]GAP62828.1 hypothetical protein ARMA_1251 [Ardenticatena maritima]
MRTLRWLLVAVVALTFGVFPVSAQEGVTETPAIDVFSRYPVQVLEAGQRADFELRFNVTGVAQTIYLDLEGLPEGWDATFQGGGDTIQAIYVRPEDEDQVVRLRVEVPDGVEAGSYPLTVIARGDRDTVRVPLEIRVKERVPAKLSFTVDLPVLRGTPTTTFRYSAELKNEGDEEITANLTYEAPQGFLVTFKLTGQETTSVPLGPNESKRISIEVKPYTDVPAGQYPVSVAAVAGESVVTLDLVADITGQPELSLTTEDGRLSANATAGKETPVTLVLRNDGTASALNVELSASAPSNWSVEFDPKTIEELPVGQEVKVNATIKPTEKAVAGDYIVTMRARPENGNTESAEFRITVTTSTLWGIVGVALIAVAVGVVALAVMRFGRR